MRSKVVQYFVAYCSEQKPNGSRMAATCSHTGSLRLAPRTAKNSPNSATALTLLHSIERVAVATAKKMAAVISSVGSCSAINANR